jgi:glycosyltransferase involved in cell wall biosynthesis
LEYKPQHVLHILTKALDVGGDTRMVWRWIQQDSTRQHSVVLTRQGALRVPALLQDAVRAAGGQITILNEKRGGLREWAQHLRSLAQEVDLIAVHVHPNDVLPAIAFAIRQDVPPIVYVNHADHVFWVGTSACDLVVSVRGSGAALVQTRRHISAERNALLPLSLPSFVRTHTRTEAKALLGLPPQAVVLLSVARPHKYDPVKHHNGLDAFCWPETLIPILARHPEAVLLVVGPEPRGRWAEAAAKTQNRIRALGTRDDTALFYQAADVYLDSFPFASVTSLLEAGSYGVPLLSFDPFDGTARVLAADSPGLDQHLIKARDIEAYEAMLEDLLCSPSKRTKIGTQTQHAIAESHSGQSWSKALEYVYERAMSLTRTESIVGEDQPSITELDELLPCVFHNDFSLDTIIQHHLRLMPTELRYSTWASLMLRHRQFYPGLLLPEWVGVYLEQKRYQQGIVPVWHSAT